MKKCTLLSIVCLVLLIVPSGCEDFLEEEPKGFATSDNLFNNETAITQVLYGVYDIGSQLFWRERYLFRYGHLGDDQFRGSDSRVAPSALDNYTFTSTNNYIGQAWTATTAGISRANHLLEGIADFEEGPFKDRIIAETKFLRALFYFIQVRSFGSVPLLTTYEDAELFPSKASIPEIYDQIIADFSEAIMVLPGWQEIPGEKGRATSSAAKAFLGKVYLTMATTPETSDLQYFDLAASILKEVIDNEGYGLIDKYVEAFQPQNEGGIEDVYSWQFLVDMPSGNQGYIHAQFQPNPGIYNQRGFSRIVIMPYLYDMLESEDQRKQAMLKGSYKSYIFNESGTLIDSAEHVTPNDWPHTIKYLDPDAGRFNHTNTSTNLPLIRYADVLLMYSEAINESVGSTADAYMGIDMVRARSNATEIPRGLDQDDLRQYIRDERLLELHGEGHRWFDLVRWEILEERIKEVKPDAFVEWPKHRFFPFPQTEIDVNPNLEQNPGYVVQ